MNYYMGIDLGSTTCKVVIIDDNEHITSKGITNTRSNYKIATDVAEQDAVVMGRFEFLRKKLAENIQKAGGLGVDPGILIDNLELAFRYQQYMENVDRLLAVARDESKQCSVELINDVLGEVEKFFDRIKGQSLKDFKSNFKDRGIFFRDLIGIQLTKYISDVKSYNIQEKIIEIFDKSILEIENSLNDINFKDSIYEVLRKDNWIDDNGASDAKMTSIVKNSVNEAILEDLTIVRRVGTGYGRQRLPFPKSQIQSEILCHGMGAHYLYPSTRTVLDIGGQDTKAIQVDENGIVVSFVMNDRCAAGCGRFLGYVADELKIGLQELGPLALEAKKIVKISSTCTVFAGVELRDRLSLGERRSDILAGLHRSIVRRAISLIARAGGIRDTFTFTGGVAKNVAVVKEIRDIVKDNYGDITINLSPDSIYVGALGAALFAKRG
ncbi:benzoyl-CoA reductase subunit A [Candidatus Parcubacteria bacterium]|nr:MAG: benzoyl-CoA reductase subunit A [Candidatus Parcubacteria bacterium]